MLNLSVICPLLSVRVEIIETREEFLRLYGSPETSEDDLFVLSGNEAEGYEIIVNQEEVDALYAKSWLADFTGYGVLIDGIIIQQLARLRYSVKTNTFDQVFQTHLLRYAQNPLYHALYETIFSYMAEYRICYEFPELSDILELFHSAVSYSYAKRLSCMGKPGNLYVPYVEALEKLLHYHAVSGDVSINFINFSLPFCLLAKRTDYRNVINAALLIEEWLQEAAPLLFNLSKGQKMAGKIAKETIYDKDVHAVTAEELDAIDHEAVLRSVKSRVQDIAKEIGLQAGSGSVKHHTNEANAFFLTTIQKYRREISELEYIFKQVFTSMKIIDSFEGDVNMKRLQDAYLSSKSMEPMKVFQYYQKKKVSVDIMILRDVSGSTYLFEKEYAEAIILILAAVNNFMGIRTLEIDFGGEATLNKSFSQPLEKATIGPRSGGGTNLLPALAILQKQILRGRRRLLFILSDGEINDLQTANGLLEEMMKNDGVEVFKIALGELSNHGYEYVNVKNLHKIIAQKIIEKGMAENEH